jgi:hypothetical protein
MAAVVTILMLLVGCSAVSAAIQKGRAAGSVARFSPVFT